jgi:hypothetical protein
MDIRVDSAQANLTSDKKDFVLSFGIQHHPVSGYVDHKGQIRITNAHNQRPYETALCLLELALRHDEIRSAIFHKANIG